MIILLIRLLTVSDKWFLIMTQLIANNKLINKKSFINLISQLYKNKSIKIVVNLDRIQLANNLLIFNKVSNPGIYLMTF
jgi:3-methyladenine DNA glycosylase AlkC